MPLSQILKRNVTAAYSLPITLIAFLNAQGIMALVGAHLGLDAAQLSRAPPRAGMAAPAPSTPFHSTSSVAILKRNPFDSVTGPLDDPKSDAPAAEQEGVADTDPWSAPPCDGVRVLAIAASSDANWSFAALQVGTEEKTFLRRRGDEIGGKTLRYVGWDRVWLTSGTRLCQVAMFTPAAPATGATSPAPRHPAEPLPKGPGALDPAIRGGIARVSATEFNVDRGVLERILSNQGEFVGSVRTMPVIVNGKMVGFRLSAIRPDSLPEAIGLSNGDLIQSINGFDISDPEKALEAYARLRTAEHLTLHVDREGVGTNIDYNIK